MCEYGSLPTLEVIAKNMDSYGQEKWLSFSRETINYKAWSFIQFKIHDHWLVTYVSDYSHDSYSLKVIF